MKEALLLYYLLNALLITRYIWLEFRKRYCSILKSLLIKQLFLPSKTKSTTVAFFFSPPSLLLAHPFRLFLFLPWYNFQACRTVFWTFLIMWRHFQINILTKKEKKNSNSTEMKLRIYCRRTGVISSIHAVKSQFALSIFIIFGILQVID